MNWNVVSYTAVVAGLFVLSAPAGEKAAWSYEGDAGPEHWALLGPEFSVCAGKNQSPIDLVTVKMIEADLDNISFHYENAPLVAINNGHTIQVDYAPGSSIEIDGIEFGLKQFHFHSPSENEVDGQSYPLEGHLVHADADGHLAVVAVLFKEGAANEALANIWAHMPHEAGGAAHADGATVNAMDLLPEKKDYYRFNGSLTTPPCTEGVRWLVCKDPMTVSKEQVDAFRHVMHHANNRPVQPVNARPVLK